MLTSLNPRDQQFVNSINRIASRLDRAQRQITTGLRLSQVSDDPNQVSGLLLARANLSSTEQTQSNLGRYKAEVDASEQALQNAVTLLERVHTLAAQGATSTPNAAGRAALAQEVGSVLEQLGGLAGTQVEGRYLFGGNTDQTPPYILELNLPTPVSAYLGSNATRQAEHPNGTTFAISHTAQEIFDSSDPSSNVFAAVTALRQALLDNNEAAVGTSLDGLSKVSAHLNAHLAFYGSTQNKLLDANGFAATLQVQLKTQIATLEDADPTAAILELTQSQTQQQAALSARAKLPRTSLFDYLG